MGEPSVTEMTAMKESDSMHIDRPLPLPLPPHNLKRPPSEVVVSDRLQLMPFQPHFYDFALFYLFIFCRASGTSASNASGFCNLQL